MRNRIKNKLSNWLIFLGRYFKIDLIYFARGGFWLLIGDCFGVLTGFLTVFYLTHYYSLEYYGLFNYILNWLSILSIFTLVGMDTALTRAIARGNSATFLPLLKKRIKWGLLGTIVSLLLAFYYWQAKEINLTFCFLILASFVPLLEPLLSYKSFWTGKKNFRSRAEYTITEQLTSLGAVLAVTIFERNIFLLLVVYFLTLIATRFWLTRKVIRKIKSEVLDKEVESYGKHLSFLEIIGILAANLDKILLWNFLGAASVAVYSLAILPAQIGGNFFKNIALLTLPKFVEQKETIIRKTLLKIVGKMILLIIPVIVAIILIIPFIFRTFFPNYLQAIFYAQVYVLTLIFVPQIPLSVFFTSYAKKKALYLFKIISPFTRIIFLTVGLIFFGILGAIWAVVILQLFNFVLLILLFLKDQPSRKQ